ncbi:MAG: thioredoxin family protein [Candidatus Cloacimonetes bacterium]|nr:thioredoxin family protein [Candidatus Cloacimonadota bacterium]
MKRFLFFFILIFLFISSDLRNDSFSLSGQSFDFLTSGVLDEITFLETNFIDVPTGSTILIAVTFNIPEGFYAAHQEDFFGIDIEESDGITGGRVFYPEDSIETDFGFVKYEGSVTLLKELIIAQNAIQGEREIEIVAFYQICLEDGTCLVPTDEYHVLTLYVVQGINETRRGIDFSGQTGNALRYILFAFLGGIILNLMPCVLPILSIRAFNLVSQSNNSPRNILINSTLYVLGILISFIVLATVVTVIKLSGEMIGWGFQFQNPMFMMFLLSLMFIFSLSLFNVFTINIPGMNTATKASSKSGYLGSFLMGIFCVLLATPCTAPLLGAALGFAFAQPPLIIYTIFLSVGFGLGFPFLLIGFFPKAIKILPKPGEWMNVFKEILGFLLLAFAVSMVGVLVVQGLSITNVLYFLLILAFATWLYGRFVTPLYSKTTQWIIAIIAILTIIIGGMITLKNYDNDFNSSETVSARYDGFWDVFSESAFQIGLAEGRPIFIDFTADWCTVCKMNDAVVLSQSDIRQAFIDNDVLMLKGDFTRRDPVIQEWLRKYNRAGVPLYLLFIPGQEEAIQFPELLTKQMIFNALRDI